MVCQVPYTSVMFILGCYVYIGLLCYTYYMANTFEPKLNLRQIAAVIS